MATYTVYRLTFKTQLHLGRASGPAQEGKSWLRENRDLHSCGYPLLSDLPNMGNLLQY